MARKLIVSTWRKLCQMVCGINCDYTVHMGRRVTQEYIDGMIPSGPIRDDVIILRNATMGVRSVQDVNAKPVIGSRVHIGAGAVLVENIRIGNDVVIDTKAVVSFDAPDGARVRPVRSEVILGSERAARPSVFGDTRPAGSALPVGPSQPGASVNSQLFPL